MIITTLKNERNKQKEIQLLPIPCANLAVAVTRQPITPVTLNALVKKRID